MGCCWEVYTSLCSKMDRLALRGFSLSRLLTVLTETWPPPFNSYRIRAVVVKRFLLAHRDISLSMCSLVGSAWSQTFINLITVACERCIRRSTTEWCTPIYIATIILLQSACDMPTACHLCAQISCRIIHNISMKTLYTKNSTSLTYKHILCNYVWHHRHEIAETLLKVAINTKNHIKS